MPGLRRGRRQGGSQIRGEIRQSQFRKTRPGGCDVAETMPYSAMQRRESRGAHYRTDYTKRDDTSFLKHSMAYKTSGPPRIEYSPVTVTRWKPEERVY